MRDAGTKERWVLKKVKGNEGNIQGREIVDFLWKSFSIMIIEMDC